jgi:hypothetical protein
VGPFAERHHVVRAERIENRGRGVQWRRGSRLCPRLRETPYRQGDDQTAEYGAQ